MNFEFMFEEDVKEFVHTPTCLKHYCNNLLDAEEKYLKNHFEEKIPTGVRMSKQSIYSSAFLDDAEKTSEIIKKILPSAKTITDATANVGCNTINFSKHFDHVNSVEIEPLEFQRLEGNIKSYNIKNIKTYNEDYLRIIDNFIQDIVFIDAPWGGHKYNLFSKLVLCLGKSRIDDIANYLISNNKAKVVVLKTPRNVWLSNLKYPYKKVEFYRNMKPFYTLWFVSNTRLPDVSNKVIFKKLRI